MICILQCYILLQTALVDFQAVVQICSHLIFALLRTLSGGIIRKVADISSQLAFCVDPVLSLRYGLLIHLIKQPMDRYTI